MMSSTYQTSKTYMMTLTRLEHYIRLFQRLIKLGLKYLNRLPIRMELYQLHLVLFKNVLKRYQKANIGKIAKELMIA